MAENNAGSRDLVLPPNTYAFVLDATKGKVSVYVGPFKNSLSNTDQLVTWDANSKRFVETSDPRLAILTFPMAPEGHYLILTNPSIVEPSRHPSKGTSTEATDLDIGRKVNLPGPTSFPLWPGQVAETIEGHHLRNNQYLIVRVYDEQQARQNWRSAVIAPQVSQQGQSSNSDDADTARQQQQDSQPVASSQSETMPTLTMGQLMVVKGTEVSFYIPPTGIEVVPDDEKNYVREAVTLERLEYCILLDENGEKRYVQGPAVVFPKPTEKFIEGSSRLRKFRAIELSEHSGLYIKVITEYQEGEGQSARVYRVGEELFIKGTEQAIYFPREEHSIIEYGSTKVHYAIAIPAGEGRYVLDRNLGTVDLVRGPKMFLPDPRTQVVVRRILDRQTIELLYPGNQEALAVNRRYQELSANQVSGEHLLSDESTRAASLASASARERRGDRDFQNESFSRGSVYSPPRTIVLDTKYEGAVGINIWPGYAVLVVKKTGERRVEVGPKVVLLEYDETLMPLELSTGRPKTDDSMIRTAYLRVNNNQVGDLVSLETRDLVKVAVEVSYRVNFEGQTAQEQLKWFEVENYVKILADHARSRMRNAAKRVGIQEFYASTIDILRDAILGDAPEGGIRPGLPFTENLMRVYDIEILDIKIEDQQVARLLVRAQEEALSGAIELSQAQERATRTSSLEDLKRQELDEHEKTAIKRDEIGEAERKRRLATSLAEANGNLQVFAEEQKLADAQLLADQQATTQEVALARLHMARELEELAARGNDFIKRVGAIDGKLAEAITALGDKTFVEKIVTALGPAAIASGSTTADLLGSIFKGTPWEKVLGSLAERPLKISDPDRSASN